MKAKNTALLFSYFFILSCSHRTSRLCNYILPPTSNKKEYIQAIINYVKLADSCRSFLKNKEQANIKEIKITGFFCDKNPIQVQLIHYHYLKHTISGYSDYYYLDKELVYYRSTIFLDEITRNKKKCVDTYYFKNDSCIYYTMDIKQDKQQIKEAINHALKWSVTYFDDFDENYQEAVKDTLTRKAIEWKKRFKKLDHIQRSILN